MNRMQWYGPTFLLLVTVVVVLVAGPHVARNIQWQHTDANISLIHRDLSDSQFLGELSDAFRKVALAVEPSGPSRCEKGSTCSVSAKPSTAPKVYWTERPCAVAAPMRVPAGPPPTVFTAVTSSPSAPSVQTRCCPSLTGPT